MSANLEHSNSPNGALLLASVVDQLACPACHGGLHLDGASLSCGGCGRVYSIIDGIPVLIAESGDFAGSE
jgi:hypothetical protein